jgi:hypothetical protein
MPSRWTIEEPRITGSVVRTRRDAVFIRVDDFRPWLWRPCAPGYEHCLAEWSMIIVDGPVEVLNDSLDTRLSVL